MRKVVFEESLLITGSHVRFTKKPLAQEQCRSGHCLP